MIRNGHTDFYQLDWEAALPSIERLHASAGADPHARKSLAAMLRAITSQLRDHPLEWGEAKFDLKTHKITMCIGFHENIRVVYGVHESARLVFVRSLDAVRD